MQRTDTEMLDFLFSVMSGNDANSEALLAAHSLGYSGREAVSLAMGAQTFEPGEPLPPVGALDLVADEIKRIREVEGFGPERDDLYVSGELALAASCYVTPEDWRGCAIPTPDKWPVSWADSWWKPSPNDRLRELVKGTALAACEIDRLLRNPPAKVESPQQELAICGDCFAVSSAADADCAACGAPVDAEAGHVGDCPKGDQRTDEGRAFGIVKGSRVRVVRAAPEWEGWVPAMGKLVGNQYIVEARVEAIRTHPATVLVGDWHIPASCCEIVP